jgi:hypothetical protein
MSGFLAKFLRNNIGNKETNSSQGNEPMNTVQDRPDFTAEEAFDNPDESLVDYELLEIIENVNVSSSNSEIVTNSKSKEWEESSIAIIEKFQCKACGVSLANSSFDKRKISFCPFCGVSQFEGVNEQSRIDKNSIGQLNYFDTVFESSESDLHNFLEQDFLHGSVLIGENYKHVPASQPNDHGNDFEAEGHRSSSRFDQARSQHATQEFRHKVEFGHLAANSNEVERLDEFSRHRTSTPVIDESEFDQWFGAFQKISLKTKGTEIWEVFLNASNEEQPNPLDPESKNEDQIETDKIITYASHLTNSLASYRSMDRRKLFELFVNVLGDFPSYQSYAAIKRLLERGSSMEHIQDVYSVKLIWASNSNIWSDRRYNKVEKNWLITRNESLRNSMSWKLASDFVNEFTPTDLENLILNDWYSDWMHLTVDSETAMIGVDPAFILYPSYLYHKRNSFSPFFSRS